MNNVTDRTQSAITEERPTDDSHPLTNDAGNRQLPDDGRPLATACPACEADLVNVQGLHACTHCTWTAN
jgi:hypothetical protein